MKHLRYGIGLLAILLAVSLWLGGCLEKAHMPCVKDLDKAAEAAMNEEWPLAAALYTRAGKQWQQHRNLTAALVRHDLMEQVDSGFSMLDAFLRCEDTASFAATCSQLARQLRSLPQSHSFSLWNLL